MELVALWPNPLTRSRQAHTPPSRRIDLKRHPALWRSARLSPAGGLAKSPGSSAIASLGSAPRIRTAHCLGAGSGQSRRTRHRPRNAGPKRPHTSGPDHHRGQRIPAGQLREHPQRSRYHPHPSRHQNREITTGTTVPAPFPPDPSSRSTTPSRPSWISNDTADEPNRV